MPTLRTDDGLTLSLAAALQNHDIIDASAQEREQLQRAGYPFGGVQ